MATKRQSGIQRTHRESVMMTLGISLPVLERGYRAIANQAVAHVGLSQALAWPLLMIGRRGDGLRQGVLADLLNIEGPSLARSVDQLQQMGFIDRREDPADRRAKTLHLTASGAQAAAQIESALTDMRELLYQGIPDEELETCLRVFTQLRERLGCAPITWAPVDGIGSRKDDAA
jgi:MarR family transcriptional regulator for hemolysin